jgi:hypothetical protein
MHARQAIREAVVTALRAANTNAQQRVYETRVIQWRPADLPAIAVYTLEETSQIRNAAPRELVRTVQLAIEAAVVQKNGSNVDDDMDSIAQQIERAMHADETFGGLAADSVLTSTEIEVSENGAAPIGVIRLVYTTDYFTFAPDAADQTLDDLKTVDTKTSLGGAVNPGNQSEDKLQNLDT